MKNIADIRKDYQLKRMDESDVAKNPFEQFTQWWNDAIDSKIEEVNAMTLCTATKSGKPSARVVLLKGYNSKGFIFFTNYESSKGKQLEKNPNACLVFYWKELERQIKIEGIVEKLKNKDNDEYFFSRPEGSRIGAWASPQSSVIADRSVLEGNVAKFTEKFEGKKVPRPPHWGGYIVKPTLIEFWQGRPSRLHDRIQYTLPKNKKTWTIERLAP